MLLPVVSSLVNPEGFDVEPSSGTSVGLSSLYSTLNYRVQLNLDTLFSIAHFLLSTSL